MIKMECFKCGKPLTKHTIHFWSRLLNKPIPLEIAHTHNVDLALTCADCQIDLAQDHLTSDDNKDREE